MKTGKDLRETYLRLQNLGVQIMSKERNLREFRKLADARMAELRGPLLALWRDLLTECHQSGVTYLDEDGYLVINQRVALTNKAAGLIGQLCEAIDNTPKSILIEA